MAFNILVERISIFWNSKFSLKVIANEFFKAWNWVTG